MTPRKGDSLFLVVTTGTEVLTLVRRAATFYSCVSPRAAPNNSSGSKPPGRLPRPDDCGLFAPRPRNICVPHADQSKRRGRAVAGGLISVLVRHEGGLGGDSLRPAPGANADACRGPIKATRSGAVTRPDTSRSLRSHFLSSGRCVRPWLPQFGLPAPRHARLSHP